MSDPGKPQLPIGDPGSYALPAAPRRWPVVVSALVVGLLFIVPHLALYLPGGLYDTLPLWPLP